MAERTQWTVPKIVAAVIAGLSVILLMTPLHELLAQWYSLTDKEADGIFTAVLSVLVVLCSVVLYREVASLKFTVVLLALALFLVFAGTLAQVRLGIWEVINHWFRYRVVHIHFEIFTAPFDKAKHNTELSGKTFPFPGGFLILGLLSISMIAAMVGKIRSDLKSSARGVLLRRHAGIYILHVGMLVLFAGEFITGFYADEGNLVIQEGSWCNFVEDAIYSELAFVDTSDPEQDRQIVIPQAMLQRHAVSGGDGELISHDELPYDIEVQQYMRNSESIAPVQTDRMRGIARQFAVTELPPVPGTETKRGNLPAVYVTLRDKVDGRSLGTWLCVAWSEQAKLQPGMAPPGAQLQSTGAGMPQVELRLARRYMPYRVYLDKIEHDVYDGTDIPHNFSSDVRVVGAGGEAIRPSHIWMNHPMRYDGKTFYQSQMTASIGLTGLQVVTNPGVWLPYISCAIVTLGLLIQFTMSLVSYTRRSVR